VSVRLQPAPEPEPEPVPETSIGSSGTGTGSGAGSGAVQIVIASVVMLASSVVIAAPPKPAKARPEAAAYLEELERRGLIDKTAGSPKRLADEVRLADDELVRGEHALAAARLYAIVEAPRWQDFSETDDFQDAEYRLGQALAKGGSYDGARRYYLRSIARGKDGPFYVASLRGFVDVCLEARTLGACVAELDRAGAVDANEEIAYLRGRAAFEGATPGSGDNAEEELARVSPKSRFYSSALYLRGVSRVKRRDFTGAKDAFCAIADVKDGDSLRFYIDGRYYALKDLARLALGRLAHEEKRDDDAFYHYFLIPQDSPRLAEALFEAAWSSLSRKEFDLGARLVEAFLKEFPESPRVAEARLLFATLQVKTCRFADAEKGFDKFLVEHEPMVAAIDRALADAATRQDLAQRLLEREARALAALRDAERDRGGRPAGQQLTEKEREKQAAQKALDRKDAPPKSLEDRLAELLEIDPRFFRLASLTRGLEVGAADAASAQKSWQALAARLGGQRVQTSGTGMLAPELLARSRELAADVARARAALRKAKGPEAAPLKEALATLETRQRTLLASVERAIQREPAEREGAQKGLEPMVRADGDRAVELGAEVARLQAKIDKAAGALLEKALIDLRGRMEDLIRRARLGKIDAVVGQKRRLEKQIEDLAAGRFPPELFGKLHLEGLIGDDEEYWPPEQEIWLDEYENYQ